MRRAIAAAVVGVLVFGGATAIPAFAAEHGADKAIRAGQAEPAARAKATTVRAKSATAKKTRKTEQAKQTKQAKRTAALKTVIYHGYELRVPEAWPVYRLDEHPATCVRYDTSAVYLGTPGANMRCPAGLVGRTQTVSVIPSTTIAAGSGSEVTRQRAQPDDVGGTRVRSLAAVRGTIIRNAAAHEMRVALGAIALGATVLGTYGTDPGLIEKVLASLRTAPRGAAATAQTGSWSALSAPSRLREPVFSRAAAAAIVRARSQATGLKLPAPGSRSFRPGHSPGRSPAAAAAASVSEQSAPESKGWHRLPPDWPIQVVVLPPNPTPKPGPGPSFRPVSGFDACTTPSLDAMRAWRARYGAVGVYIGGLNTTCSFGNLSAPWVRSVQSRGWGLLPTYVGLQAPCTQAQNVAVIVPGQAEAEGRAEGLDAVHDARVFGLSTGSPIFDDMEAYAGSVTCSTAVLRFLGAWDRAVSGAGYRTAVYSSQDSGIADMQAATLARTPGFTAPEGVWFADWDGVSSLTDGSLAWPLADRVKQYAGTVWETIGGYTMNVDLDLAGGPLAR